MRMTGMVTDLEYMKKVMIWITFAFSKYIRIMPAMMKKIEYP